MNTVYTVGYEGTDIERFVATLVAVGVTLIADVRAVAISRKKGFSKSALKFQLDSVGIEYCHFRELGDPKPGRVAARDGRYQDFEQIYLNHLSSPQSQLALKSLYEVSRLHATCLLCFERDPKTCHRSIIADRLPLAGKQIVNLYGDFPRRYENFSRIRSSDDIGKGASAA